MIAGVSLASLCLFLAAGEPQLRPVARGSGVSVERTAYHRWPEAWILRNGLAEVVVVPETGRVMQFQFVGEEGPFWENRILDGKSPDPKAREWGNFGGDKTWPSPQSDWGQATGRAWPPPPAFDAMPVKVEMTRNGLVMTSAVDPFYGIQTRRRVELAADQAKLAITTRYDKIRGPERRVGVWVITQCKDPAAVFAPLQKSSLFPAGYKLQSEKAPPSLVAKDGLLSLKRDSNASYKVGTGASELLWVGQRCILLIESSRVNGAAYPDDGASAEVYTNPDPLAYVELELLGPTKQLKVGERIERTSIYRLFHRRYGTPAEEAGHWLGR